ncbi:MAG: hypothetical protein KKD36_06820 [Bacteroidetes bacterium]|nr:hypothetical protein [Bacteroidota bacterium]
MKKITLLFIFFFALASYSQTKGITYQAVLLNPAGNQTRGVGQNLPLMDKQICMSFKFVDEFSNVEYQEVVQAKTDSYGMVNLIIGSGEQTAGYASSFSDISWSTSNKKLVVGVNTNGNCTTFIEISNQDFSFVPFAYAATNAENVTGVVSIENGGTNATTVIQAKTNLQLQNVNNTADLDKPISTATQTALGIKVDKQTGKGLSTEDYTSLEKTKLAAISGSNTGDQDLSTFATNTNLSLKVDKVAGKGLSTEDYSTVEKAKLAAISGSNTGDQDLSSFATNTNLALKVDKVAGKGLSTEDYTSSEKTKLAAISGSNTGDQDLSSFATNSNLDLKANVASPTFTGTVSGITATMVGLSIVDNTSDVNKPVSIATQTALDTKVDKEIGKGLSTEDYSTVDKTKLAAITGSNTGDQDLSSFATNSNLDLKANVASPTFTGTVSGITATMVGLSNVDNTSDANKPVSTAAQTALDTKANLDSPTLTGTPLAPTAAAETNSIQIATTEYVTTAISTSGANFLALNGGVLTGTLKGTYGDFSSNFRVGSLTLVGNTRSWDLGPNGNGIALVQGGCCRRLTIDEEGRFGIGANYDPLYQLDVQGDGRFTSDVTATAFKILNGTASQFLKADGSIDTNTYLSSTAVGNFVDLTADQSINGDKRFSNNILVRETTIGSFGASDTGNIGFGIANYVYGDTSTMQNNTAIGNFAFTSSSGSNNTAIGTNAIRQGDGGSGDENTAVGTAALTNAQAGNRNTAVGAFTMTQAVGSENTAIGNLAGMNISTGSYNTFLGSGTGINSEVNGSINNATAIGSGAKVDASNTIILGNSAITDVITSGKITTGAITIPNTDGDAGQVLSTNGSGVVSWITPATASSSTFVDVSTDQNIAGNKVFEKDVVINGVAVGRGKFNENSNTAIGLGALENNEAYANTAVGRGALASNVSNGGNTALGYIALVNNVSGSDNVAVGSQALETNISGSSNTAIGKRADVSSDGISNSVAIGANAFVTTSNTIQLGSDGSGSYPAITNVNTSGVIKAGSVTYPNSHNSTSGQVLTMSVSGLASWENNIQYKQVVLSNNTNDQTPVTVGGLSIRVNNKILEISRVTNNDPNTVGVYATVYNGNSGAFNANLDGSGGPVTPKFGTTIASANVGTWSSLLDDANGVKQEIGTYYFKLEADLSVYNSAKTYKLTVLTDGWGKVIMRLIYYPE